MATKITIAHSPDSDDAFMFYGFASGAVDTEGLEIAQVLADIETLNRAAVTGTYEVTAASFHAFAHLSDKYALLPHGASMGDNYGPMVVVRQDGPTSLDGVTVAIPGALDQRLAGAAAVSARPDVRGDAVRRDPRSGPRRQGRRRPADSRRPAHRTATKGCACWSISACGGPSGPAACRCRSAAT